MMLIESEKSAPRSDLLPSEKSAPRSDLPPYSSVFSQSNGLRSVNIAILGDSLAGKTSLIQSYMTNEFSTDKVVDVLSV